MLTVNDYKRKTKEQLRYIIDDATLAAQAMQSMQNTVAEGKYRDQVNDACSELYRRSIKLLKGKRKWNTTVNAGSHPLPLGVHTFKLTLG